MRPLAVLVLLFAAAPARPIDLPKTAADDREAIQGEWVMAGLDVRGEAVPARKLAGTRLVVRKDTYTTVVGKKEYPITFTLDPAREPKHIDMMIPDAAGKPQLSRGIYRLDGNRLVICRSQTPGGSRPRAFVSGTDDDVFVVTWERNRKP